jgi:hypothetical protein
MRNRQLQRDGYVQCEDNKWTLTEKGWRTLSGAAETPVFAPVKQSKSEIACELRRWGNGVISVAAWITTPFE